MGGTKGLMMNRLAGRTRVSSLAMPLLLSGGGGALNPALAKGINLTIFLVAMYLLVRKPAREFFAARLAQVRQLLEQAAREKQAATAKMAELDARIGRLDVELAAIREQTKHEIEAERVRIEAETAREAARLRETSQREIESAKLVALTELRDFAAKQADTLAEEMILRQLTPEDDARLIGRVIEGMTAAVGQQGQGRDQ